jgi:hypothetical protein
MLLCTDWKKKDLSNRKWAGLRWSGADAKEIISVTAYGRQTLEELRDVRNTIWAQIQNT